MAKISQTTYTGILILLTTTVVTLVLVFLSIKSTNDLTTTTIGTSLLTSAMNDLEESVIKTYGHLKMNNGELVDESGEPIRGRFEVVDYISKKFEVNATIFVVKGNDFERVSTSVKKSDGSRAIGTLLGSDSPAYKFLRQNKTYLGLAKILGKDFITFYKPIVNDDGKMIGVYFVGKSLDEVQETIKGKLITSAVNKLIAGLSIGVVASIISIMLNYYIFSKKSVYLSNMIAELSTGKLKLEKINVTSYIKEIQITGEAISKLSENISKIFLRMGQSIENLSNSAGSVKNGIENLSKTQSEFFKRMEEITKAIQSISASAQEVASNVAEFSTAAQRLSLSVEELSKKYK